MSALPHWCTYAFLTTMLSKASILVNISSFTLRELSFPLDMLTKLIVYCSQHVRTAGFALDCKMFGKPHAFSEAISVPSVPASAVAFAFTQNTRFCPWWARAEQSISLRLTKQHWISCNHGQILPGSHMYSLSSSDGWRFSTLLPSEPMDKPVRGVSQGRWSGDVPVVSFPPPRGSYGSSWQQYCPWRDYNGGGGHAPPLLEKEAIFNNGPVL